MTVCVSSFCLNCIWYPPPPTSVPLVSHNHLSYLQPVQLVIHMHAVTSTLWFPPTLFLRTFYFFLSSSRALPSVFVFVLPGVSRSYISTAASLSFFFSFFFFSPPSRRHHMCFSANISPFRGRLCSLLRIAGDSLCKCVYLTFHQCSIYVTQMAESETSLLLANS